MSITADDLSGEYSNFMFDEKIAFPLPRSTSVFAGFAPYFHLKLAGKIVW